MIREVYQARLFIGDAISARDLKTIYDHGFTAIVDLATEESPAQLGRDHVYCRFPLSDDGENRDAMVEAAIVCLRSLLDRQFVTLLACSAGMSRSPSIAAATVSWLENADFQSVLLKMTSDVPHDVSPALLATVQRCHASICI